MVEDVLQPFDLLAGKRFPPLRSFLDLVNPGSHFEALVEVNQAM